MIPVYDGIFFYENFLAKIDFSILPYDVRRTFHQIQEQGCGYASIKMLAGLFYNDKEYEFALEKKIEGNAPSIKELLDYGETLGLKLKAYKYDGIGAFIKNARLPCVAITKEGKNLHAVVVHKIGRRVHISDPKRGNRRISIKSFMDYFDYLTIECLYYQKKEFEKIAIPRFSKGYLPLVSLGLGIISLGLMVSSFLLGKISWILSFLALILSISMNHLQSYINFMASKRIDAIFLPYLDSLKQGRGSAYRDYLDAKSATFRNGFKQNVLNLLFIIGFILILFSRQRGFIFNASAISFSVLLSIFFSSLLYYSGKKVEENERRLLYDDGTYPTIISKSSNSYISILLSFRAALFLSSLVLALFSYLIIKDYQSSIYLLIILQYLDDEGLKIVQNGFSKRQEEEAKANFYRHFLF